MDMYKLPCSTEDNFKEIGFGSWEGRTPEEIKVDNRREFEDFYRDPVNCRPQGAEPLDKFIKRVTSAYEKAVKQYQGKHLLIVAHAGVNRAIISHALHAAPIGLYRINVKNAGISRIKNTELGNTLLYHNVQLADMV
jgi:probable phosphoglycerate mutase